jgi:hypothetical protein
MVPDQGKGFWPRVLSSFRSYEPSPFQGHHRHELFSAITHQAFFRGVNSANRLEEIAKSRKCTVSDLMRQAVRNILRVAGKKEREL